jgi:hypothetical protein
VTPILYATATTLHFWPKAGWGALGALVWIVLIHGLPVALKAAHGQIEWKPTRVRSLGVCGLVAFYLMLGAAAPFIVDASAAKDAFAWGLAWQSVFGESARQHLRSEGEAARRA